MPVVVLALATFVGRAMGGSAPWTPAHAIPVMVGVQIITGAVGEELGRRGYLLPRLRPHVGTMGAGWTMAVLWSLWHLPAFFTPGMPHQTVPMIWALLAILFFGVFLAFVFIRAGESIWAPMAAHLSFNIMSGLGGAQLSSVIFWRTLAGALAAVAFLTLVASRRPHTEGGGGLRVLAPLAPTVAEAWHSRPLRATLIFAAQDLQRTRSAL